MRKLREHLEQKGLVTFDRVLELFRSLARFKTAMGPRILREMHGLQRSNEALVSLAHGPCIDIPALSNVRQMLGPASIVECLA